MTWFFVVVDINDAIIIAKKLLNVILNVDVQ